MERGADPIGCVCPAQLPASFFAFRKQQHRWTCGPVQLWRRCSGDIWNSSLPLMAKLELLVLYFGIRKFATHWVSLGFFCTLVPLSVFTPEVRTLLTHSADPHCSACCAGDRQRTSRSPAFSLRTVNLMSKLPCMHVALGTTMAALVLAFLWTRRHSLPGAVLFASVQQP